MKRTASAVWQGSTKEGKGTLTTQSHVLKDTAYSFRSRFEDGKETNPEELIGAAHAGCYCMALSLFLGNAGFTPERLAATASVSLEQVSGNWTINAVHLDLTGKVPKIDEAKFKDLAEQAKAGCPVSRLLNAKITLSAKLEA
jgi:osmotically inducible protein OsmC